MPATVECRALPSHLHVVVSGEYEDEEIKRILAEIQKAAHDQPTQKILIDCLGLTGNPSLRQRVDLALHAMQLRVSALMSGRRARYATAIVAVPPLAHPHRHGLRLLLERNMKVVICDRHEDAYAWLGLPPPDDAAYPRRNAAG